MLLKNFNLSEKVYDLSIHILLGQSTKHIIKGVYCICDNLFTALYAQDNQLVLQTDKYKINIKEDHSAKIEKAGSDAEGKFFLFDKELLIVEFRYKKRAAYNSTSPWEWLDEEDFDRGALASKRD